MILNILTPTMILIKSIEVSNKYNWEFQSHYRSDFNMKYLFCIVPVCKFKSHYRSDFNHINPPKTDNVH